MRINGYIQEDNMQDGQVGEALDIVIKELNKISMCKRGVIDSECNVNYYHWREKIKDIPKITIKQREKIYVKHRKELMKILKLRTSKDLVYLSRCSANDMHTDDSKHAYTIRFEELMRHPDEADIVKYNKGLDKQRKLQEQQKTARHAELDARVKELRMSFITEELKLKDFPEVLAAFEAEVH
jgi:hypothetical protein